MAEGKNGTLCDLGRKGWNWERRGEEREGGRWKPIERKKEKQG